MIVYPARKIRSKSNYADNDNDGYKNDKEHRRTDPERASDRPPGPINLIRQLENKEDTECDETINTHMDCSFVFHCFVPSAMIIYDCSFLENYIFWAKKNCSPKMK